MKFSIVIPVYNVEKYLDACVESVIAQTYQDFEVILVDDGSPDRSGTMCDLWAAKDARVRVIHQENQGLSGARNTGIREARGEYVMVLDSDDWWEESRLVDTIAIHLERTQAQVLSLNYRKVWSDGQEQTYFADDCATALQGSCDFAAITANQVWIACAWNKVIQRQLFLENDLFFIPGILSEDIDWCVRLALCAERFAYLGEAWISYRQRPGSLTQNISADRVDGLCQNVEECLRNIHTAQSPNAQLLQPYVAYQYATVLHNYAGLSPKNRSNVLRDRVKALLYLLNWSNNGKVKLLRSAKLVLGFDGMLLALRIRQKLLKG